GSDGAPSCGDGGATSAKPKLPVRFFDSNPGFGDRCANASGSAGTTRKGAGRDSNNWVSAARGSRSLPAVGEPGGWPSLPRSIEHCPIKRCADTASYYHQSSRALSRWVQPPDAENGMSGGVGGLRCAIAVTRPDRGAPVFRLRSRFVINVWKMASGSILSIVGDHADRF